LGFPGNSLLEEQKYRLDVLGLFAIVLFYVKERKMSIKY
jgi:hypothetical protein